MPLSAESVLFSCETDGLYQDAQLGLGDKHSMGKVPSCRFRAGGHTYQPCNSNELYCVRSLDRDTGSIF